MWCNRPSFANKGFFLAFVGLTQSRGKRENQNASNSAAFNEIATSQQLLLSRLPLGFAAFDQRPCFLPNTRSWRFMPAPKVRKNRFWCSLNGQKATSLLISAR